MNAVFVTGLGIISALGTGVKANAEKLRNSRSGIGKIKHLSAPAVHLPGGEVDADNQTLKSLLDVPHETLLSRTSLLGAVAAREALAFLARDFAEDLPLITGTTIGGMDISEVHYRDFITSGNTSGFKNFIRHDCGDSSEKIAELCGIRGDVITISTACSSSANAIMLAARTLRSGENKRALAGGADALAHFTINGFRSLMISDSGLCKPFDNNRAGLNLGEGAAFLLLENEESLKETGNTPLAVLAGWGNANDAYHQTASSPEGTGASLAMKAAIDRAGVSPPGIDYINAHGTGTANNDLSESKALLKIFGEQLPLFSSTKAFTGHTLAAAGAVEAVFSIIAMSENALLPNLNFQTEIEETQLRPVTEFTKVSNLKTVLSNSFGFGGNNTSLIFKKA